MLANDKYSVINIRKMIEDDNPELGESNLMYDRYRFVEIQGGIFA